MKRGLDLSNVSGNDLWCKHKSTYLWEAG